LEALDLKLNFEWHNLRTLDFTTNIPGFNDKAEIFKPAESDIKQTFHHIFQGIGFRPLKARL
jgi:hypothetical protein